MPRKYDKLGHWLQSQTPNTVRITISELERTIDVSFPTYVHKYPWSNDRTQGLAREYMAVGYLVSQPTKDKEELEFRYAPDRASELMTNNTHHQSHRRSKERRNDVPTPSKSEVEKYLAQ